MKRVRGKAVSLAFKMARGARESMRDLDHLKTVPAVEIFALAVWLAAAVVWLIAIKVGAVPGMRAGIFGFAGIIAGGCLAMRALRAWTRRDDAEYYGSDPT